MESDQNSPTEVDAGLLSILALVAEARGMSLEEAAAATSDNFREFYAGSLERMGETEAAEDGVGGEGRIVRRNLAG